uniref:non-specific serine/threonine protein kinase n=1 Tax=Oryza meridionalis TaxID=40149 RepID=A0A0E0EX78_9ORYZ
MKHLYFALHLLICFALPSLCTSEDRFLYSGFSGANLIVDGAARVRPNGLLEVTNGTVNLYGHAFHPAPLHFRRSPNGTVQSFSVSFVFGISSVYRETSVDGMAFLIAPSKNLSGVLANQFLGLLNSNNDGNSSNHIFAVELDTFQNTELKDINDNHVGIDINSVHSIKSQPAGFYDDTNIFRNLSLNSGEAMQIWVDYKEETTQINVTMAPLKMAKPVKPLVCATYNLSEVFVDPAYIGFSSSTGPISTQYIVLGWSFCMGCPAPVINVNKLPKLPHSGRKFPSRVLEIILPIATAALILSVGISITLFIRRRLRYAELHEDWEEEFRLHRFSYKDLFHATQGFKNEHLLGAGGFGKVYRGVLPTSKLIVAVKKVSHESRQGMKEFITEIVSIGHLRHRNLVQLLGYCRRNYELLLVYDYMPNGSLDKFLYCEEDMPTLGWSQRFHIIKGVACGLLYLHEKWEKVVIHRDIKASNVLLDSGMNGRLGDFGLARLYDHGSDPQTTHVVGTMGYLAPELVRIGKASPLTDVYAFGSFLLEVVCGQKPIKEDAQGNRFMLVNWVLQHWHNGTLVETVDKRLQVEDVLDEVCLVLKLAIHPLLQGPRCSK